MRLLCRRDWYLVPKDLRDRVWASWRSGLAAASREHREAVLEAMRVGSLARLPAWRRQLVRLRLLPDPCQRLYPLD